MPDPISDISAPLIGFPPKSVTRPFIVFALNIFSSNRPMSLRIASVPNP